MSSLNEILQIAQVVFGIGLVIFVHELGHYIAARICGVRVETFSLGFGPRLLGVRRGETMYQVALVPLGGYCRMAGEENRAAGRPPRSDELPAKSVGQRFFIYSGGVLMNVAFGIVVFPILFWIGVPFHRPVVEVVPGGAAWMAGVPDHSEVVRVNGRRIHDFMDIPMEVAVGDPDRTVLEVRPFGSEATANFELEPIRDEDEGYPTIGVRPDVERDPAGRPILDAAPDSPAWEAGLRGGERLVAVVDGIPGMDPARQLGLRGGTAEPLVLRVLDDGGERTVRIVPREREDRSPPRVGIATLIDRVRGVRPGTPAEALGFQVGDRILEVRGIPILRAGDWERAIAEAEGPFEIVVERSEEVRTVRVGPGEEPRRSLLKDVALGADLDGTRIVVQPGGPAERAGMRDGDRVLAIDGEPVEAWADVRRLVERAAQEERACVFQVARGSTPDAKVLELSARPEPGPLYDFGLSFRQAQYVYRSQGWVGAVGFGLRSSWNVVRQAWLTLRRMLFNDVSPKNVGGIITISAVSYTLAETGWTKLFFFLCILSINLAFLNVLPIPVLDGGHLLFLLVEGIKGSPVSRRTLDYSQMVGVVLLLTLMVYVTYNDIVRWDLFRRLLPG